MKRISVFLLSIGIVCLFASAAAATKGDPHKVTLCHRTAAYTNPYVVITVDVASVIKTHGHDSHNGPVFSPDIPKHVKWGDIIPAFDHGDGKEYDGQNLSDEGQAILDNGCKIPPSSTTTTEGNGDTTTTALDTGTTTVSTPGGVSVTSPPPFDSDDSSTSTSHELPRTGSTTGPLWFIGLSLVALGLLALRSKPARL